MLSLQTNDPQLLGFLDNLETVCEAHLEMTALAVVGVTVAIAQLVLQLISLLKKK
jgi:hypothetical protein